MVVAEIQRSLQTAILQDGGAVPSTQTSGVPLPASGVMRTIRRAIAHEHDLQVYAVSLLKAGSIPKTSSGKMQRYACRIAFLTGTLDTLAQWTIGLRDPENPGQTSAHPIHR